ncbi:TonB-dependent receptor [Aquimarina sp. RZ0]|uniref:TonB-dependent receptor domain-containing protein n=1 Tax=Aquimarina sp. RZ0 TaxID=2607730 RepID=UPI0011F27EC3|nr:TonB-dependent receptor [Aquimarina sp. RZ0]KAA1243794.1 outer membrane beta-barrel protein [Aquimarina sp. RZ0]
MNKILTYLLFFISFSMTAQVQITGKIIDKESNLPIEFAEIVLINGDFENPIGTITNESGIFKLKVNSNILYTLQVFYVGQTLYSQEITANKDIDLGIIEVQNSQQLEEVIIAAKKKLVERKIDRLVFNVENSTKASEGNALEVLKVTPGVRVQNDNITMIGKSNLKVMINDKIVQLSEQDLASFLRSVSSEDIKNIEVITTPPAKYEAAGNSGLINIKLKEAKKDSWNAQLKSYYRQRRYPSGSLGGNFNFNKNKFSIASSINYRDGDYFQEQDDFAFFTDGLWHTSSPFRANIKGLNGRIDVNYNITSKWSMGAQYLYNKTDFSVTDAPFTIVTDNNTNNILRSLQSDGTMDLSPEIHSVNYNNEIKIDTTGRKIMVNLDYFKYDNPDTKTYNGRSIINDPFSEQFYRGINTNIQDITNYSGKIDIEYPTPWVNLSFGGKISVSESINDISLFNSGLVNNPITDLPLSQNDFQYDENIQAVYLSLNKKFNDKWNTQLGIRFESTQTTSMSDNLNLNFDNDYDRFFPTLYIFYKATENSTFAFNYSKRIERPSFFQLNPNLYFVNPFQTIEGNAFLQPAFIDNLEFTNTYKNFVTKLYYSYEDDMFSQVPLPNSDTNLIRFTNENFINTQRFGISENYSFDRISWWSSNNSFDLNYSISEFTLEQEEEDQRGVNATISSYNDFILNESKTFLFGLNYWYSFPGVNGIFDTKSSSSFSVSLQWLLLNKDLNITLRGNDLFRSSAERTETTINGVFQTARYYYDSQYFQLSLSYKFGNKDIKAKKHQTGNKEEKGRTGN